MSPARIRYHEWCIANWAINVCKVPHCGIIQEVALRIVDCVLGSKLWDSIFHKLLEDILVYFRFYHFWLLRRGQIYLSRFEFTSTAAESAKIEIGFAIELKSSL